MSAGWHRRALDLLEPTDQQDDRIQAAAQRLEDAVAELLEELGWEGRPRIEGSLAKGTYLRGDADLDLFVAFPPDLDRGTLVDRTQELGRVLTDPVLAYAEHPYVQGLWEGHDAEIVPCYDLEDPTQLLSAVDRTPFHTEYLRARLDREARSEVRLLKAFLQHVGAYGAEESVLGVSGYVAELLVLHLGDFRSVLAWAVEGCPHPIVLEGDPDAVDPHAFEDPLVVIDPVDPDRNAAAAIGRPTLQRLREAAAAFRQDPSEAWFGPRPHLEMSLQRARQALEARESQVLALRVPVGQDVLEDPLHAQLRRATRLAVEALERDQVPVAGASVWLETAADGTYRAWALVEASARALEQPKLHRGPPVHAGDHADRFRKRWEGDPEAVGELFEREGHLFVRRRRSQTSLSGITLPHLRKAKAGKAVDSALAKDTLTALEGDAALEALPPEARAALLDRRRPWEATSPGEGAPNGRT